DACWYEQKCAVVGMRKRLAIWALNSVAFPLTNAHRTRIVGEQEVERRRHHHLVAPGPARDPTVFFQIVGRGGNDVRHRVDDIAAAISVEIHRIFLKRSRHELRRPKSAGPRSDQVIGPDVSTLENLQRGKKLLPEIILAAANAGKGSGGTDDRALAYQRTIVGFDSPDGGDDVAIHPESPLHGIEGLPILVKQRPALLDPLTGHQDVEIVPEGFGELGL